MRNFMFISKLVQYRIVWRDPASDSNQCDFDVLMLVHVNLNILIYFKICLVMLLLIRPGKCGIAVELSYLEFQSVDSIFIESL